MYRKGPYKMQPSKNNPKKLAKVFHAPSDNLIHPAKYIEKPTFNMTTVKSN